MDTIPVVKPHIGPEEHSAVAEVLASGMLVQGAEVAAFEEEFSAFVNGHPCVAVSSGTSALHLGLLSCGVGPGDEVIIPSFTFAATANAVALTGARPVFADIEPHSFCLDPSSAEAAITPRTVGIMPVHLYGQPADMRALRDIAARHGLAIFEDACQAHAASWRGQPVGTFGQFGAFSFYATKNMTTGEGGMIVCANEQQARSIRVLRNQGMRHKYEHEVVGFNARMTDLAATIGRVQLRKLPAWTEQRRSNAITLNAGLQPLPHVTTPPTADEVRHVYHQYTIRAMNRDALRAELRKAGIETSVHYPIPTHRLPPFTSSGSSNSAKMAALKETDRACREVISLPVHPGLSHQDLERTVVALVRAVRPIPG